MGFEEHIDQQRIQAAPPRCARFDKMLVV
jgi:hypothetical protein